jgi:predicted nucleotidyltransferase
LRAVLATGPPASSFPSSLETGPTFLSFMGLRAFLEDHLGRKIDLVTPDALKPRMRPVVEREAVDVA